MRVESLRQNNLLGPRAWKCRRRHLRSPVLPTIAENDVRRLFRNKILVTANVSVMAKFQVGAAPDVELPYSKGGKRCRLALGIKTRCHSHFVAASREFRGLRIGDVRD